VAAAWASTSNLNAIEVDSGGYVGIRRLASVLPGKNIDKVPDFVDEPDFVDLPL
jgi:hypothetical protein